MLWMPTNGGISHLRTSAHDVRAVLNFDKRRTLYNLCTSRSLLDNDVKGVQNLRTAFLVTKRMSCACVLETYHMCCLQSLRQSVGALVTNLVGTKIKDGHRLVALVTFLLTATQPSCKKLVHHGKWLIAQKEFMSCETGFVSDQNLRFCCDARVLDHAI